MPHLREFGYEANVPGDPSPEVAHRRVDVGAPRVELVRHVPVVADAGHVAAAREFQQRRSRSPALRAVA